MKKIFITALAVSVLFLAGCYDAGKNAKVRINLGNVPVAKNAARRSFLDKIFSVFVKDAVASYAYDYMGVTVVHIAAYSGDKVVAAVSIDASEITSSAENTDYVELTVPEGQNITILVVGESNLDGNSNIIAPYARYYGYTITNLIAGEVNDVSISMHDNTYWSSVLTLSYNDTSTPIILISWIAPGFRVKYHLYFYDTLDTNTEYSIYEGFATEASYDFSAFGFHNYNLYLEFEPFNLRSQTLM